LPLNTNKRRKESKKMKDSEMGVVAGIVTAMIHKEMFNDLKTHKERREEVVDIISKLGKAFD